MTSSPRIEGTKIFKFIQKQRNSILDEAIVRNIGAFTEMLREELETTDGQTVRIKKIVDHLHTFARRSQDVETEQVNMNVPLKDSLTLLT